jgi:hypothetical protein
LEDLHSRGNIADWQIRQAEEAVQLYSNHFRDEKTDGSDVDTKTQIVSFDKDFVMAAMQKAIRVKHYSLSTERTYMDWARRFFDYAANMKGGLLRETPGTEKPFGSPPGRIIKTPRVRRRLKDVHCSSS